MSTEKTPTTAPVDAVVMRAVCDKWRENQANIAGGKGTWPNPDYVRDATWDGLLFSRVCGQFCCGLALIRMIVTCLHNKY